MGSLSSRLGWDALRRGDSIYRNQAGMPQSPHGETMTTQQRTHLVVWLLVLWDFCDDLLADALLCGDGARETMAALDDIETELERLGIDVRDVPGAVRAL